MTKTVAECYRNLLHESLDRLRVTANKDRPRKRAAECLDIAVREYLSLAMPSGFKSWSPDAEHIKQLVPGQNMVGFLSAPSESTEKLRQRRRRARRNYYRGDMDDEKETEKQWEATSLFRLMRLGMVTPMASGSSVHDHNMRSIFAGLFDSFATPAQKLDAGYAICSFSLPDYKQILASDYVSDLSDRIKKYGLLLQQIDYDMGEVKTELLDKRMQSLEAFLKGSTSWMYLDLPIGGESDGKGFFKFHYSFSLPIRAAHSIVDTLFNITMAGRYYSSRIPAERSVNPKLYSGLHSYVNMVAGDKVVDNTDVDMRKSVLMALLYPGLLVDHGCVAGYVMCRAREGGSQVSDVRTVMVRTVDDSMQSTIWHDKIINCNAKNLIPNPLTGAIVSVETDDILSCGTIPLDIINTSGADHQDIFDSIFGAGYVRALTSKRIGGLVSQAINEVMDSFSVDGLLSVYVKFKEKLDAVCPMCEYAGKGIGELTQQKGNWRPAFKDTQAVLEYLIAEDNSAFMPPYYNNYHIRNLLMKIYPLEGATDINKKSDELIEIMKAREEADKQLKEAEAKIAEATTL